MIQNNKKPAFTSSIARLAKKLECSSRIMGTIALLCILVQCAMAYSLATDQNTAIFAISWVIITSIALFLLYRSGIYANEMSSSRTLLIILAILVQMTLIVAVHQMEGLLPSSLQNSFQLILMPWIVAPGITAILIGRRMGTFTALAITLLGLSLFPITNDGNVIAKFVAISTLAGVLSANLCGRVHHREQILSAGFIVGLSVFFCMFLLGGLHTGFVPFGQHFSWKHLSVEFIACIASSFMYAVILSGILPLLERIFNLCTPITWLELGDMNHKILKELQLRAPGTFHHSLIVSRLAESAAEAIHANPTHCSVCALFHDIGKLKNPQYFAENIPSDCVNPHDELTPDMSARIIIAHVEDGVELAEDYNLNSRIVDAIREHHGVSNAYFFLYKAKAGYDAALERFDNGQIDSAPTPVDPADYSYKGPIPSTKESGIISMADAIESASRSLKAPTSSDISSLIESIFRARILDGHLNNSQLTLGEIELIKESFLNSILSMHHNRIAYPKALADCDKNNSNRLEPSHNKLAKISQKEANATSCSDNKSTDASNDAA